MALTNPRRRGRRHRAASAHVLESVEPRQLLAANFTGTYFDNADLTAPVLTRPDPAIDFNWAKGDPASGMSPSTFSARWTGFIQPASAGTYTFLATADDGVRLTVNNTLVIDQWHDRPRLQGDINADGVVNFGDYQQFERLFRTASPQADFDGDGTVTKADRTILLANLNKTLADTAPTYTGTIDLDAGQTYTISLEYYQNSAASSIKLEWQSAAQPRQVVPPADPPTTTLPGGGDDGTGDPGDPPPPDPQPGVPVVVGDGNGLLGTYYDGPDFTGQSISRIDPTINFTWDGYRPHPRIDTTTFSVRWEGLVLAPRTGDYTFYTTSDDGIRMWVKEAPFTVNAEGTITDPPILNYWGDQAGGQEYPSDTTFHMEAGHRYNVRVEYYQNEGGAMAQLRWSGPVAKGIIPTSQLFPTTTPTNPTPTTPPVQPDASLRVSDDGHFIVRADGSPFFYLADTAWSLFNNSTRADVDLYLQNRADKEFTVTQAVLYNPDAYRANKFNQPVFINNNPANPNPAYFDHVDYTLQRAQTDGLYIAMLPTWGDAVAATDSRRVFNTANAYTYGQWLGSRYANQPNIIWVLGGDWPASDSGVQAVWRAMAQGLHDGDGGTHLITYHPPGNYSSSTYFNGESWLDFNTIQSGHVRDSSNYTAVLSDYARNKPVIDAEPNYENIYNALNTNNPQLDDYDVRKKTYWSLFAGAFGAAYGNLEVYQFYSGPTTSELKPWQDALNYPGAGQMKYARRLMQSRPYLGRVPDQSLIASANTSGTHHLQATRGGDRSYAFVYSTYGDDFDVDLTKVGLSSGATLNAWWYNPRNGQSTSAGQYTNDHTEHFTPPSSGYGQDWVLVLDDASRGYNGPGQVILSTELGGTVTGTVSDGVDQIPYRLYKPSGVAAGQKVPLILYLHGKGERGTDNVLQTTWMGGLIKNTKSGQYASYVLAPQIDTDMWFQSYNSSPTEAMKLTIQLVKQVIASENVDPTRVYVTGVSMGGMGVWDILRWEPNLFAAAIPMSGGADPSTAPIIKDIPVWAFHGSADDIVPVSATRTIIQALKDAGGNPKYTEIAGGGHVIWDPIYYDNSHTLYAWLFSQQHAAAAAASAPAVKPVAKPQRVTPLFSTKPLKRPATLAK